MFIYSDLLNKFIRYKYLYYSSNPESFDIYKDILKNYKNISLYFYKFNNKDNVQLPLKEFDHISEATYYRLFIEQHLPVNLREILYVDADVFCINNVENKYIHIFNEMDKSKFTIAARNDGVLKIIKNYLKI